jgi:hypothetical protein
MRNATTETAERGYEIFKSMKIPTLARINRELALCGREPIHERSFVHYGNLIEYGVLAYMPINQFDVKRQLGIL